MNPTIDRAFVNKLLEVNSFPALTEPTIICFRNTDVNGNKVEDTGMNLTDIYFLVDDKVIIGPLTGRSYANARYQAAQIEWFKSQGKTGECANKIASGFYQSAWTRGLHFGCKALVQNRKFLIIRSYDAVFGNDDDFLQFDIVADNFHGWSPASAGCCTVAGNMTKVDPSITVVPNQVATGDWAIAEKWIYEFHATDAVAFTAIILEHEDLQLTPRLRVGSQGDKVKELQGKVGVTPDGDYGSNTHSYVKKYQRANGLKADGIWNQ